MNFKNLPLSRKLLLAVGFPIILVASLSIVSTFLVEEYSKLIILPGLVLAIVIAVLFSKVMIKSITKPLKKAAILADEIAHGDMDHRLKIDSDDELGTFSRAFNTMVSAREEYEKSLKEAMLHLGTTLESTDNAILVTTEEGIYIRSNSLFGMLFNLDFECLEPGHEQDMAKAIFDQLSSPDQIKKEIKAIYSDETSEATNTLTFTDGTILEYYTKPMQFGSKVIGRTWSFRDITDRVNVQNRLVESKQELEAAVKAKSEFLANMSHEIRTPMNGVLGMLELAQSSHLDEEQRHRISVAQNSAKSLLSLINDILDFSKIEAGKLDLEVLEFNLRDMFEELVESVGYPAQDKGLKLIIDIDAIQPSLVKGDPGRLRQILTNILSNAIKFTSEGEILIRAWLEDTNENDDWMLHCEIKDTGIGIPPEKTETLFDSFSQVDASTTREFGGTGLGLSIVRQLCELMQGRVSVSSTVGQGSLFSIEVKLGKSYGTPAQKRKKTTQSHEPVNWPEGSRILLVEDNQVNQLVAVGILNNLGLHAEIAGNGLEALELIRQTDPDAPYTLILMDCQMPKMDGYATTRAIRAGKVGDLAQTVPIVAMTANALKGDREKCLDAGMTDYLSKPVDPNKLCECLKLHLLSTSDKHASAGTISSTETVSQEILPSDTDTDTGSRANADISIWNEQEMLNRVGGLDEMVPPLIEMFHTESSQHLSQLEELLSEAEIDYKTVAMHCHTLKGMAANLSATELQHIALELETAAKSDNHAELISGFSNLVAASNNLNQQFQDYLNSQA